VVYSNNHVKNATKSVAPKTVKTVNITTRLIEEKNDEQQIKKALVSPTHLDDGNQPIDRRADGGKRGGI